MLSLSQKSTSISILVATAFFMENLDGTVIATALPQMGKSFHVSPVDLNIGMTAYLLMLAVFIPISGWVADRVGARSVFVSAIAIFTVSSILCGLSNGILAFTCGAHYSGNRRRDDGACGAARCAAHDGKTQFDARRSRTSPGRDSSRPSWGLPSAASSPRIFRGTGFSSSMFRSASLGWLSLFAGFRTCGKTK